MPSLCYIAVHQEHIELFLRIEAMLLLNEIKVSTEELHRNILRRKEVLAEIDDDLKQVAGKNKSELLEMEYKVNWLSEK